MGVPGGLYRPTPQGYNGNPAGRGSQPSVSMLAGFSAGHWGPPTGGSRRLPASWPTGQPHRLGALSAAGYCCLAPDDEGFVEGSVATVLPPCGLSRSLTLSCLLNDAHVSREGGSRLLGAGYAPGRLGEAGPPSCLSLAKGAAARGPYWRLSWMTLRPAWLQCRAAREMAVPYGLL